MKVAIDAGPLYGHRTGVGLAADGMIRGLDARDDITLTPYLISGRATPQAGHRRLAIPGIAASHLWSRTDHPRADRWLVGADLVHGTNYVAPPTRLPTIVSVYDCWFLRQPELASRLVRRAGNNLRRAVRRGAWIHTSSEATSAQVRELLDTELADPERVVTVPLGPPDPLPPAADDQRVLSESLRDRRFIVAIGTEERRKGLPLLVEAFGRLAAHHPELLLVLAGAPGDDSKAVRKAIDTTTDPARVVRLGPVDDDDKSWLLRNAAVLAYPSLDEGFGFPVLEAQSAGIPVAATPVGSIPEVAGEGAQLSADRTPDAFAAALDEALVGGGRDALIEAGSRNLKRFDWATTADQLVTLYRRAVDG